jgi:serine/threonine protein kinase
MLADPRDVKIFIREIIVPLQLQLPGIVPLIGFKPPDVGDSESGGAFLVSELMPNGCLDDIIGQRQKGKVPDKFGPTEFSKCIFGVAATMARVHRRRVIHRDLKPANIFLDDRFEPRIADFGLSRIVSNDVKMTMTVGTPLFMAPELFGDASDTYDVSVDVYAFTVLVHHMFGQSNDLDDGVPTRSPQQAMIRIMHGARLKKHKAIPDELWGVICNCWAANPKKRWSFSQVTEWLSASDVWVAPGTDIPALREYQERIGGAAPAELTRSMTPNGKGTLTVSVLASRGNTHFENVRAESDKVAERPSIRRYDFTRLKYKGRG